jgi:hypothetical protein
MRLLVRSQNDRLPPADVARYVNPSSRLMDGYQSACLASEAEDEGPTAGARSACSRWGGWAGRCGRQCARGLAAQEEGSGEEMKDRPHVTRRGKLKNGNPSGDLSKAPRCGARTRRGTACRAPAMPNGRCRLHGGLSTGPRTPEGLERSRRARWRHGFYSREFREMRVAARRQFFEMREAVRRLGLAGEIKTFERRGPRFTLRRVPPNPS